MVARADIGSCIDEAEEAFEACWRVLVSLRGTGDFTVEERRRLVSFQSDLATALYSLRRMDRRVTSEQNGLIAKKDRLNPGWFSRRMATLAEYRRALASAGSIGRQLGDSFCWIWYSQNRDLLAQHARADTRAELPAGLGGLTEVEFVKQYKMVGQSLVLYHGVTDLLRVADLSLVDMDTHHVDSLGEIKFVNRSEGALELNLYLIGRELPDLRRAEPSARRHLEQAREAQLQRQVRRMREFFRPRQTSHTQEVLGSGHFGSLDEVARSATTRRYAVQAAGDSLLLIGGRDASRRLSTRVLDGHLPNPEKAMGALPEAASGIVTGSSDDVLLHGTFYQNKDRSARNTPGMMPVFWWPIDVQVAHDLIFGSLFVMSLYNPTGFYQRLRSAGFTVSRGDRGVTVTKELENRTLYIRRFSHFVRMVTDYLMDEVAVASMLEDTALRAERLEGNAYVELVVNQVG